MANNQNCNSPQQPKTFVDKNLYIPIGGVVSIIALVWYLFGIMNEIKSENNLKINAEIAKINSVYTEKIRILENQYNEKLSDLELEVTKKIDKEIFDISIQVKRERITSLETLLNYKIDVLTKEKDKVE